MATLRALVRWAVLTSLLSAILFIAAGSTEIPSLRDYVAVLSALLLFTMVAVAAPWIAAPETMECSTIKGVPRALGVAKRSLPISLD